MRSAFTRNQKSYRQLPTTDPSAGEAIDLDALKNLPTDPAVEHERSVNSRYRKRHIVLLVVLFMAVVFAIMAFVTFMSKGQFKWRIADDGTMEENPEAEDG